MNTELTVYFDYLCPYANRTVTWLESIKDKAGNGLSIYWKTFSIEQQNSKKGPEYKLWEHPGNSFMGASGPCGCQGRFESG